MLSTLGLDYNQLVDLLKDNVLRVTFTKVDGTERVMECTLQESFIPVADRSSGSLLTEGDGEHERISVWDVQANGWRSFYLDSVKGVASAGYTK